MTAAAWSLVLFVLVLPAGAEDVTIMSYNIYGYGNPGAADYQALVRIVEAFKPDVLLFQEADDNTGRGAFMAYFAAEYPHSYLGGPTNGNPRNQILSAYPMDQAGSIYTDDPDGGSFERPTVWADLDVLPNWPGPELRVYSAHYKSGSTSRDSQLRENQAHDDADHITAAVTADPELYVWHGGDLNAEPWETPIFILTAAGTTMHRVPILNPKNGDDETRWPSGKTIDHVFHSDTLNTLISNDFILHTETWPPDPLPSPALINDSHTASDHLALIATVTIEAPGPDPPDYDHDGDIDQDDYIRFADCVSGPTVPVSPGCENRDLDEDGDADQADFGLFQGCLSGPEEPYDPTCAN